MRVQLLTLALALALPAARSETATLDGSIAEQPEHYFVAYHAERPVWLSTGLFAPENTPVHFALPRKLVGKGEIQIGFDFNAPTESDSWFTRQPIRSTEETLSYQWGGLIYIVLPPGSNLGKLRITANGAIRAPHFILHQHDNNDWTKMLAERREAPWAELEIPGQVIISVPTSHKNTAWTARMLKDPMKLLTLYEKGWIDGNYLSLMTPRGPRPRTERIIYDMYPKPNTNWSMYAGYPIVAKPGNLEFYNDADKLEKEGGWGYFHELGHLMQMWDFTPWNDKEVTCNFWAIYMNRALGLGKEFMEGYSRRESRLRKWDRRQFAKDDYDTNFLKLDAHAFLAEDFQWETVRSMIWSYMRNPVQFTEEDKKSVELWDAKVHNEWARRYCGVIKRDVSQHFEWFGWKLDQNTKNECGKYPYYEAINKHIKRSKGGCRTTGGYGCTFPFAHKGRTYYTCTADDNGGRMWCASGRSWGDCDMKTCK